MRVDLDYFTSKLDYKTNEVQDIYTLNIKRAKEELREGVLKAALNSLLLFKPLGDYESGWDK